MLYIVSIGETVIAARLTEKDALTVIRDALGFDRDSKREDRLDTGLTSHEKIHRVRQAHSGRFTLSGYRITEIPNPMTQHLQDMVQEVIDGVQESNGEAEHEVIGYEWGVKIQEASGIERILDPESLHLTAVNRLEQYRKTWPTARLVRRPVYNEPWEEVVDA